MHGDVFPESNTFELFPMTNTLSRKTSPKKNRKNIESKYAMTSVLCYNIEGWKMRKVTMLIALSTLMLFTLSSFAAERQGNPSESAASPSNATSVFEKVSQS